MATVATDAPEREVGENPLVEGLERLPVAPTTLVIFGASGDLAKRKLLPALYNLAHEGALPERFNLIGAARREQSDDEFREMARESIESSSRAPPGARRRRFREDAPGVDRVDPPPRAGPAGARRAARAHALRGGAVRRLR